MIWLLLWIGFCARRADRSIAWPFHWCPRHIWRGQWRCFRERRSYLGSNPVCGVFRNRPGVIRRVEGRLLPRRWGIYFFGFEFGDRGVCGQKVVK